MLVKVEQHGGNPACPHHRSRRKIRLVTWRCNRPW